VFNIEASVVENQQFENLTSIISVRAPEIAKEVLPGQFLMAAISSHDEMPSPLLKRALAIYRTEPEEGNPSKVWLLIKIVGEGTKRLATVRPGDRIDVIGPLGNGFDLEKARNKINFLVVGGTGIASVYLLAERLISRGEEVHLVYGGRSSADLVGIDDFHKLEIPIFTTTEDGTEGYPGLVTEGFSDYLRRFPSEHSHIFTCGPTPMMQAVTNIGRKNKIPVQISVEVKMGCGFGVCLGCTVKTSYSYQLACTQGPVFDGSEFIWEKENEL
jgi:dihydroorotate dehydrogenase electron transfer subunit